MSERLSVCERHTHIDKELEGVDILLTKPKAQTLLRFTKFFCFVKLCSEQKEKKTLPKGDCTDFTVKADDANT